MNIILVGAYPIDVNRIANGVEAVVAYLVEGLLSIPELELTVISVRRDIRRASSRRISRLTVHYLPSTRRLGNISLGVLEKFRVLRLIRSLSPDIVHVHNHAQYPFLWTHPSIPTVTTIHGFIFMESQFERESLHSIRRVPRLLLERLVFSRLQHVIAVSSYVKSVIERRSTAQVQIIENPVAKHFFEIRGRAVPRRLLFVGHISRRKNILDLLRVLLLLRPRFEDIELRVAGAFSEPSYEVEVRKFVNVSGLTPFVSFLGHLSESDLVSEYAACEIVVSASHEETAGMIFQQAMAAGKPVVATRVGGIADIVNHGSTGILVESGDLVYFARSIELLMTTPSLREKFAANARNISMQRFFPDVVAKQTYNLYKAILEGSQT